MFHKLNLTLLSAALFLSATAFADPSKEEMEQLSYCYGVYAATKDKKEVAQTTAFLKNAGDGSAYDKIVNNFYRQGYTKASSLSKKQKSSCYMMVYGFFGVGYKMAGQKDSKTDLDLAYCMGYVNQARGYSDEEMIQEYCNTIPLSDRKRCLLESSEELKNEQYQAGRRDAQKINLIRVMNCGMKLNSSTEQDFVKSMASKGTSAPQPKKAPKKPKPQKRKGNITEPIFR